MSILASNPDYSTAKPAYEHCSLHCSDAKKALNSAAIGLNNGVYDFAQLSLRESAIDQSACRYEFMSSKNITYVPENVEFDLKVFDNK